MSNTEIIIDKMSNWWEGVGREGWGGFQSNVPLIKIVACVSFSFK